jgi:DNA-binding PadR family transcriptional regulator
MIEITEKKLLKLISARGGAVGSRELAVACGIEYGDSSKIVPALKRMERAGLVASSYPDGRPEFNTEEQEALRRAAQRVPTAISFWVARKKRL